jgi:uncharacterized protein (DUF1330 family)
MNPKFKMILAVVIGASLGAAAVQGLHAQAKPKAYTVALNEVIDPAATAAYGPLVQAEIKAAGGRIFNTAGGKVVAIIGTAPPNRVAINEWDNLDQAVAFYKSKAYTDLAPQRDKAQKVIQLFAVEAVR